MGKHKSKRLKRLLATGGTPISCAKCPRQFATTKDLAKHYKNAHENPQHEKKAKPARRRYQPQGTTHMPDQNSSNFVIKAQPQQFSGDTLIMIVDLVTPDPKLQCSSCPKMGAIPLLNQCAACAARASRDILPPVEPKATPHETEPPYNDFHPYGW
jgi:hypothetical protein